MLPLSSRIAFLFFALFTGAWAAWGFYRLSRRIRRGRPDPEPRLDGMPARIARALVLTLLQQRTFRKRPIVGVFHSFIFYGFVLYGLVNLADAVDGFYPLPLHPQNPVAAAYLFLADVFSFLVLLGVVALVVRRFLLPSRRDFRFNPRTLLHPAIRAGRIRRDSVIVSAFILFHVGSRALGAAAKLAREGPSAAEPFASLLAHAIPIAHADGLRIFGYWGALGSVLAFLAYFPYTKHIHLFMAPLKYTIARRPPTGVMPPLEVNLEAAGSTSLGVATLEDLAWPRLVDAYACIQCNRCQDVCPASATGKSLSPAALEINKRMELNQLAFGPGLSPFEQGAPSPMPLLQFALSPEAAWACTTCGACMQVCPVEDEPMLDILDIRRRQVMIEGDFPAQLQTAFRGMERAQNPWGINRAKRMDWADGLNVPTTEQNPTPEVLYWVGCAASYDPSAQTTARAFVQLLDHAGVDYAVLGKRECCTGDSARRAGNEYLYRQLADENVSTLNQVAPKLIVASCPHCMNAIGKEYTQIGGDFQVMHHTEYLQTLVASGKLTAMASEASVTYHDPCYLGRHNGVYDAPRNLLHVLSNDVVELGRTREGSFCCGAGGAQFWKEEEPGEERIADNRFREAQATLAAQPGDEKVLAVGCPFCKSMLASTPLAGQAEDVAIRDVAELLLEGVQRAKGIARQQPAVRVQAAALPTALPSAEAEDPAPILRHSLAEHEPPLADPQPARTNRPPEAADTEAGQQEARVPPDPPQPERKKWAPKAPAPSAAVAAPVEEPLQAAAAVAAPRPKWQPKAQAAASPAPVPEPPADQAPARKKWSPKRSPDQS